MKLFKCLAFLSMLFLFLPNVALADQETYNREDYLIFERCNSFGYRDYTLAISKCATRIRENSDRQRNSRSNQILDYYYPDQRTNGPSDRQIWQNMFPSNGGGHQRQRSRNPDRYSNQSSDSGTCSPIIINSEVREVNC
jgi:hypothetical protein